METTPKIQFPPPTGWHGLKEEGRKAGSGATRSGAGLVAAHWPQRCRAGTNVWGHPGPPQPAGPCPRMGHAPPSVAPASPTGLSPWKQTSVFNAIVKGRQVCFPLGHQTHVVQATPVPPRRRWPPSGGAQLTGRPGRHKARQPPARSWHRNGTRGLSSRLALYN